MEKPNLIITIPEPCHEDWNKMLPDEKGKFCNSCNKSVFDFSNKSDTQIKDILMAHKDQKVCGHFKKSQIGRPLNISIDLNNLPKNMSVTKMFVLALFISFGTLLFSCTDEKGKAVGEIAITEQTKNDPLQKEELELLGQMEVPQQTLDTISTMCVEGTVDGGIEMVSHYENHVAGGLSIQYVELDKTIEPLVIDTPTVPEPIEHVVGMMVYREDPKDTLVFKEDSIKPVQTYTIEKTPSLDDVNDIKSDFIVYPNPTKGQFTIKYDVKKRSDILVEIVDINGITIKKVVDIQGQHTGKYQVPVDLSDLMNGIYFVNLTNEGKRRTQKVILEK